MYYHWREQSRRALAEIRAITRDLTAAEGEIIFKSRRQASRFGNIYTTLQDKYWGGREFLVRLHLFADALRFALNRQILNRSDFRMDDFRVMRKLRGANDPEVNALLFVVRRNAFRVKLGSQYHADFKFRYVDPKFLEDGKIQMLSKVDQQYCDAVKITERVAKEGYDFALEYVGRKYPA